jgi:hypothetical protein
MHGETIKKTSKNISAVPFSATGGLTRSFPPFFFSDTTSPTHAPPAHGPPLPVTGGHNYISLYLTCMFLETETTNRTMGSLILFCIKGRQYNLMRFISSSVFSLYHYFKWLDL